MTERYRCLVAGLLIHALFIAVSPLKSPAAQETSPADKPPFLGAFISTGDNYWLGESLPIDSKAAIENTFDFLHDLGYRRVYWRGMQDAEYLDNIKEREDSCEYFLYWKWLRQIFRDVDPEHTAVDAAHERGMEIWGLGTLSDWGSTPDTPPFTDYPYNCEHGLRVQHPEWVPVDRYGILKQGGSIEFAYPEARKALVDLHIRLMKKYGYDGLSFLTYNENHSMRFQDEFGFNEPIVKEFKRRHGIDIRTEPFTRVGSRYDWYRLRGEYVTAYLRELKDELKKDGRKLGVCINPFDIRSPQPWSTAPELMWTAGPLYLDLEAWVQNQIVDDFMVFGNCDRAAQEKSINDLLWMTRQTGTQVGVCTSSPLAERWKPFQAKGMPTVVAQIEEEAYFDQCLIPKQPITSLKSDRSIIRMRTLAQINRGELKATVADLAPLAEDKNIIVRRMTLKALAKTGDPAAVPLIGKGLEDPENAVRCVAALALRENNGPDSVAKMLSAVDRFGVHPLMQVVAKGLPSFRPSPRTALVDALANSKNANVRTVAVWALVHLATGEDVPLLKKSLNDPDQFVGFLATKALGNRSGSSDAMTALVDATRHENPVVSDQAAVSLGQRAASQDAQEVRSQIIDALKNLYAKLGDGCKRGDADWGYRPVGSALIAFGPEGVAVLRQFMDQTADKRLAQQAWKNLYIRQSPNSFSEVTEKENDQSFRMRPDSLKTLEATRLSANFDDKRTFQPQMSGMAGDASSKVGRWGPFASEGASIDDKTFHSTPRSLKVTGGGRPLTAFVVPGFTPGNDFHVRAWVHRDTKEGSIAITLKAFADEPVAQSNAIEGTVGLHRVFGGWIPQMGAVVESSGRVQIRDMKSGAWVDTGLNIPEGTWAELRLISRQRTGTYLASLTPAGGTEKMSDVQTSFDPVAGSQELIEFAPQQTDPAHSVHVDDVQLIERP